MQLNLDESIRAISGAKNAMLDLEDLEQGELDEVRESCQKMANGARRVQEKRERKSTARGAAKKQK